MAMGGEAVGFNKEDIIIPNVHLNGTSANRLIALRCDARDVLETAYRQIREMAPNGRDYYVEPGSMEKAESQHMRRLQVIDDLVKELEYEVEQIEAKKRK